MTRENLLGRLNALARQDPGPQVRIDRGPRRNRIGQGGLIAAILGFAMTSGVFVWYAYLVAAGKYYEPNAAFFPWYVAAGVISLIAFPVSLIGLAWSPRRCGCAGASLALLNLAMLLGIFWDAWGRMP